MRRQSIVPLALAALPLLFFVGAALSKRPKPQPCPDRRYLVRGSPVLPGDSALEPIVIRGRQISFGRVCPVTNGKLRTTARGTKVNATWRSCTGLHGKVKLTATIEPACESMSGTVKGVRSKIHATFSARHSTCGDGIVDPGAGEECDSGAGCPPAQRCNAATCSCSGPVVTPTTTMPGATTTTTIGGGQAPVALGSADNFAVLAGSTVTNTGATTVTGDLGVSPGMAVTGFPPGTVTGTTHAGEAVAAQAQIDLTTAYNDAAGRSVGAVTVAGNLGGQTLTPGLYTSTSSLEISSGDLTLDAQGDANAVFIFQMASTLTTTVGRQVILSGGAKAANVFWQVGSSATLGTGSVFKGNILALASLTVTTGATVEGRVLARTAAVTLDTDTITKPAP